MTRNEYQVLHLTALFKRCRFRIRRIPFLRQVEIWEVWRGKRKVAAHLASYKGSFYGHMVEVDAYICASVFEDLNSHPHDAFCIIPTKESNT